MDFLNREHIRKSLRYTDLGMLYLSLLCSILILVHIGYNWNIAITRIFDTLIVKVFYGFAIMLLLKTILRFLVKRKDTAFQYSELILCFYFWFVILERILGPIAIDVHFHQAEWLYVGVFSVLLVETSKNSLFFDRFYFNPTLLFVLSFLFLILLGTVLLLFPKVTVGAPLSFVDALFMATSAVCITGLSVVDIASQFTYFGQTVLIVLVQLGGLGIMTFTGFFGYFFSGGFSYKNQLMYTELLSEKKLGSVISTLLKIISITFFIEAIGTMLIYFNTLDIAKDLGSDHLFFAVFHSISSFCNAGFSIVPNGLYMESIRFNYPLIFIISLLFILGGLGFGIVFNTFTFLKRWVINFFRRVFYGKPFVHKAWVMSFNSRLIAWTTFILLVFGTLVLFILEYQHSLTEHDSFIGKLTTSFFLGSSPRSAGFNTVQVGALSTPTVMVIMLLMWIGASPASTGGGIKTTTFAVTVLNMVSLIKGKDKVEIFKREISPDSIRRASAVILLSLLGLGLSIFGLCLTEGEKDIKSLAFECFSAYGTVGLSLGITPEISNAGRVVLVISMFVGRVGALTLLVALIKDVRFKNYHYPQEKVLF
ncbi:ATPase [Olivibacter sp. SDN3]|uniref:TrkH family potassium uptake protein n=1 Tax=Olivibacter sp. SDN3 TaxID=2764720 RepID=UPI0016518190|nr:potassium transporter TrkG [Olivibacter sp. SDN3]QNL51757.1 ATPase [Olivibacter sp. SDN3]